MSIEVWFGASIVCLRFLAESPYADGRGFSHRSSEASRRETLSKRQSRKHKLDELGILLITDAERPRQLG